MVVEMRMRGARFEIFEGDCDEWKTLVHSLRRWSLCHLHTHTGPRGVFGGQVKSRNTCNINKAIKTSDWACLCGVFIVPILNQLYRWAKVRTRCSPPVYVDAITILAPTRNNFHYHPAWTGPSWPIAWLNNFLPSQRWLLLYVTILISLPLHAPMGVQSNYR